MRRRQILGAVAGLGLGTALLAAQPLAASAAGSSPHAKTTTPYASVTGAGSTFSQNAIDQWKAIFKSETGLTVNYTGVGSGAGRSQYEAGTVDFAGSDVPIPASEQSKALSRGAYVYVPVVAGGITIEYDLPGVKNLRLSPSTLAGIFTGKITSWNDPAIAADNGGKSPATGELTPVVRSDSSGTSNVFSNFLSVNDPSTWTKGTTSSFPKPQYGVAESGSDGVSQFIKQNTGTIGYAEVSYAKEYGLSTAEVENSDGNYTSPTNQAVTDAIDSGKVNSNGTLTLNFHPPKDGYPISTVSYVIAPAKLSTAKADTLRRFLYYAISASGQNDIVPLGYAPLPSAIQYVAGLEVGSIK